MGMARPLLVDLCQVHHRRMAGQVQVWMATWFHLSSAMLLFVGGRAALALFGVGHVLAVPACF